MWLRRAVLSLVVGVIALTGQPAAGAGGNAAPDGPDGVSEPGAPTVETLSDGAGPYATRQRGPDGRWAPPAGDAVLLDEAWWTPLRPLVPQPGPEPDRATLRRIRARVAPAATRRLPDRLIDVSIGDVTLDGSPELVLAHRRPFRRNYINVTRPRGAWADRYGLSAHVGLYRPLDVSEIWVAGTLTRPVVELAACNGALGVAYGSLHHRGIVETSAWQWAAFGFLPAEPLPGPGTPICVDIDGDGRTEPAITERSVS